MQFQCREQALFIKKIMCTIAYMRSRPTGSRIITGIDKGLIVSDQIIITDVIAHI